MEGAQLTVDLCFVAGKRKLSPLILQAENRG